MTATTQPASGRSARGSAGQGQWAMGYREPLNKNEQARRTATALTSGLASRPSTRTGGFASHRPRRPPRPDALVGPLHASASRHRRRQAPPLSSRRSSTTSTSCCGSAIDGGAAAPPSQLRVDRRDRRRLTRGTPRTSPTGRTSSTTGSRSRTCPTIWQQLEAVGLSTTEACGTRPRVILGSPVAGVERGRGHRRDPGDRRRSTSGSSATPNFANLPRKFKTAISWLPPTTAARGERRRPSSASSIPEHGPGFDLMVGGGLSTNPMLAQRLGAWVPAGRGGRTSGTAWSACSATTDTAGCAVGPGSSSWSPTGARSSSAQVLETEYLHYRLPDGPRRRSPSRRIDHVGVHEQQ